MVTLRRLKAVVIAVCVAAIPAMIVGSVLDRNGIALFGGLCAAVAIGCLLVATSVMPFNRPVPVEEEAARVEGLIQDLTAQGVDEALCDVLRRPQRGVVHVVDGAHGAWTARELDMTYWRSFDFAPERAVR